LVAGMKKYMMITADEPNANAMGMPENSNTKVRAV